MFNGFTPTQGNLYLVSVVCFLQARSKLSQIQDSQQDMSKGIEQFNSSLNATNGGSMTNLADMSEGFSDRESTGKGKQVSPSTCPSTDPSLVPVWTTLISELLMC